MNTDSIYTVLGIVATSLGILTVLGKWLIVLPLKNFIHEQTYPIQPTANGGNSLPDAIKHVIAVKTSVDALTSQITRVENRLDAHIEQHIRGEA
jgi:hypothetical protein